MILAVTQDGKPKQLFEWHLTYRHDALCSCSMNLWSRAASALFPSGRSILLSSLGGFIVDLAGEVEDQLSDEEF